MFQGGQNGSTSIVGPFEPSLDSGVTPVTPTTMMQAMLGGVIPDGEDLTDDQILKIIKCNEELVGGGQLKTGGALDDIVTTTQKNPVIDKDPDLKKLE